MNTNTINASNMLLNNGSRTYGFYDASLNSTNLYISNINYKKGNGSLEFPKNTFTFGTQTPITTTSTNNMGVAVSQDQLKMIVAAYNGNIFYVSRVSTSASFSGFTAISGAPTNVLYRACALTDDGTRGVTLIENGLVYVFFWTGATPSGWKQIGDTTSRDYNKVSITSDGSRMVVTTISNTVFISSWNETANNYDAFKLSVTNAVYAAISSNGDRMIYSPSGVDWYLTFWNGSDYPNGTFNNSITNPRNAFFSKDSSILFISNDNNSVRSVRCGIFINAEKRYGSFIDVPNTLIPGSLNSHGLCYVDDISSGTLYVLGNGSTISTIYALPVIYTIQTSANQTKYVTLPSFTTTNSGLTFSCWFESNYNSTWARIFDFGNGAGSNNILLAINNNSLIFGIYQGSTVSQPAVLTSYNSNNNKWNHIAITMTYAASGSTTSNVIFYLNGVSVSNTSNQFYYPLAMTRTLNYIGRSNWSADPEFFGNIDDFRVYNTVLNQTQILSIYNSKTTYNHGSIIHENATLTLPSNTCTLGQNISVPIGYVTAYAGNTNAPTGWLFCDGIAVSRTTYAALFMVIGTTYGIGDGSTTFNLPKMMSGNNSIGIFPAGSATVANTGFNIDNTLKIHNINNDQKISANQIPSHNHTINHTHDMSHTHTLPAHTHTLPAHTHTLPAHNHSITYSNVSSTVYSAIAITQASNVDSGGGGYKLESAVAGSVSMPTIANGTSITANNATVTSSNISLTSDNSSITSSDASISLNNNSSLQNDYLPSYTAFLWIIKVM
jgi:microcystin-dependent protein